MMPFKSFNQILFMLPFLHLLLELFSHYELLRLSSHCQGKLSHEFYVFWYLVMGNVTFTMIEDLFACNLIVFQTFYLYQSDYFFAKFLIRNSNDLNVLYAIHLEDVILNFLRINVLASSDNHVFFSSNNREVAIIINDTHIS